MTREELKAHCEREVQHFERVKDIMPVTLNDWKRYEEHKLVLELLEQNNFGDLISRQAVLNKIKEVCFSDKWIKFRAIYGRNGIRDFLINYIEQLPSVTQETRWIPVNERLPEEDEEVLGTDLYDDLYKTYTWNDCGKIKWYADGNYDVPIVAWMPLPKMYHTGREE